MNLVEAAARLAWRPPDIRPVWQWAEDNYTVPVSSMPGLWRADNSPWVKKLMEVFPDNRVKVITVLCSAQSSKTETMLAILSWIIAEDPSPTMWVTSNEEEALKFWTERMEPSLRNCPPVAAQLPQDRSHFKNQEIHFPTMTLEVIGANAPSKLQSRPRRFLLLDEVRNWKNKGALAMVSKRVRTFWNSRIVLLTCPDRVKDETHLSFLEGTQYRYHVPCPSCSMKAPLKWANLKWDTNEETKPGGIWNFRKLAETIRYRCPHCGAEHKDNPILRRKMAMEGEWVSHNPNAPEHLVSFTWSAMLPTWVRWANLLEEFLQAQAALEHGNHEPLKVFINESLGEPWEDHYKFARTEGYIDQRLSDYDPTAPWDREARRFLSIDVQGAGGRHFYWIVRAFAPGGDSRLVSFGRAWSIEELRSVMVEHRVDPSNVLIDTGHFTSEVYKYIEESGVLPDGNYAWKAMKGDRSPYYVINNVRQPFTWSFVDPQLGTSQQGMCRPIRQILFSKQSILDRLDTLMHGIGPAWQVPRVADNLHEYKQQVTAYERTKRVDSKGVETEDWIQKRSDDHWGSCERQALVAAIACGLLAPPA